MGETSKRIISGVTLGAAIILALNLPDFLYAVLILGLILAASLLGVVEFYGLSDRGLDGRPVKGVGIFFAVLLIFTYYLQYLGIRATNGHPAPSFLTPDIAYVANHSVPFVLMLLVIVAMSAHLIFRPLDGTVYGVTTTIFGVIYPCMTLCHAFLILAEERGLFFFVVVALATIGTDTGAYFAGRYFGKHSAGLKVSPRKTIEGYVGGFVFSILLMLGFLYCWKRFAYEIHMGYVEMALFTAVLSVISVFGDLVESAIKRDSKKKDSAALIPGHGGMLDRGDSLYFTIPIGYFYLYIRGIAGLTL